LFHSAVVLDADAQITRIEDPRGTVELPHEDVHGPKPLSQGSGPFCFDEIEVRLRRVNAQSGNRAQPLAGLPSAPEDVEIGYKARDYHQRHQFKVGHAHGVAELIHHEQEGGYQNFDGLLGPTALCATAVAFDFDRHVL